MHFKAGHPVAYQQHHTHADDERYQPQRKYIQGQGNDAQQQAYGSVNNRQQHARNYSRTITINIYTGNNVCRYHNSKACQ